MNKMQIDDFLGNSSLTIVEAMKRIDLNAKGILFVVEKNNKLLGTVTDGDIRRSIIKTGNLGVPISNIMNCKPKVVLKGEEQRAKKLLEQFQLHAIAVIDTLGKIVDIIFDSDSNIEKLKNKESTLQNIPAVIMAGGKGTRLYPYTKILPKPLIPIGDIPIVDRILNRFQNYGINEFYMTVNYRKNMIKSYLSERIDDSKITYIEEEEPLGTAGSLRMLSNKIKIPFFITNCDILIRADYSDIYEYHMNTKNMLTIVSALKNIEIPYGVVQTKENGGVLALDEKPKLSYFVNTGMYIINPECVGWIPENTFYHMTDLINKILQKSCKIGMYPVSEESFLDMGEWEELQRMEQKLK